MGAAPQFRRKPYDIQIVFACDARLCGTRLPPPNAGVYASAQTPIAAADVSKH